MKILTVGTDRKIFEEGSAVSLRQVQYGSQVDRLDIIVGAKKGLGLKNKKLSSNVTAYPTNSLSRFSYFLGAVRIAKKLDRPDMVSAQDPFESGIVAYAISRYWGVPLHLQVHTDFLSPYFFSESLLNKIRVFTARILIKKADSIRVVTERIKQSIVNAGLKDGDKITVSPIAVDVEKIKNSVIKTDLHDKYSQFDFIILMASRITKEKNIGLAIEAMKEIVKPAPAGASGKHSGVGLIIVGDGSEKEKLKILTTKYSLQSNVIFEDWSDDLPSYYKTADLFLLTSNYEGYGMTVVEALATGLPVVMSDVGVAGEVLIHGQNGLVFAVGDLAGLILSAEKYIKAKVINK